MIPAAANHNSDQYWGIDQAVMCYLHLVVTSAANRSIGSTTGCTITEKAPTRAFSWLKAPKRALTPRGLNLKLGPERNYHKGRAVWLA